MAIQVSLYDADMTGLQEFITGFVFLEKAWLSRVWEMLSMTRGLQKMTYINFSMPEAEAGKSF